MHENAEAHFETLRQEGLSPEALLAVDALRTVVIQQAATIETMKVQLAEAERQSLTDSLTRLGNRRAFDHDIQRIYRELSERRREGDARHTLLVIGDLDHFKLVNDVLGYEHGDDTLVAVAKVLQKSTRHTDGVYRLGGDEFAVLAPVTPNREEDAYNVITDRFYATLEELRNMPDQLSPEDLEAIRAIDVSFAYGIFTTDHESPEQLFQISEQTMRNMKATKEQKGGGIR